MRRGLQRVGRFLKFGGLGLLTALILLAGTIQVQERILRYRAERLLSDVMSIELRRTKFEQLGPLLESWAGFVHYDVPCSRQHCDFSIQVRTPNFQYYDSKLYTHMLDFYRLLGGRFEGVIATIKVRNGLVWGERYWIGLEADPFVDTFDRSSSYELEGEISTTPRANPGRLVWPSLRKHPDYQIGWPSVHRGRLGMSVVITPYANPAEIRRLAQFNFSCLTGRSTCRTQEDLMPVAMAEISKEHQPQDDGEVANCDLPAVQIVSRDAENAAVVDVIENSTRLDHDFLSGHLQVRLVQRIKRSFSWQPGAGGKVEAADIVELAPVNNDLSNVRPGDRLIILFDGLHGSSTVPDVSADTCGVVPYSERNLAVVRSGVAQDERVPPFIEYDPQFTPRKLSDRPAPPQLPDPLAQFQDRP